MTFNGYIPDYREKYSLYLKKGGAKGKKNNTTKNTLTANEPTNKRNKNEVCNPGTVLIS